MSTVTVERNYTMYSFEVPDGEHIPVGKARTYFLYKNRTYTGNYTPSTPAGYEYSDPIDIDSYVVNGDITLYDANDCQTRTWTNTELKINSYMGSAYLDYLIDDSKPILNGYFPNDTKYVINSSNIQHCTCGMWQPFGIGNPITVVKTINYVMDGKIVLRSTLYPITAFDDFLSNVDTYEDKECTIQNSLCDSGNRTISYKTDTIYCKFKSDFNHTLNDFVTVNFKEREDLGRMLVLLKGKYSTWADVKFLYEKPNPNYDNPNNHRLESAIPIPQTSDNRVFEGWYYDEALTQKFSINDAVPDYDVTLYPKFVEDPSTKYWTLTVTEAGYPDRTYRVKDGDSFPYQAIISSNPNKHWEHVYLVSWNGDKDYYAIKSDTTLNMDNTDDFVGSQLKEDGYLFINETWSGAKYDAINKKFTNPTDDYWLGTFLRLFAFDHDLNIVDFIEGYCGVYRFYKYDDPGKLMFEIEKWSGEKITLQEIKDNIPENNSILKFYTGSYDYTNDKYTFELSNFLSNGSEIAEWDFNDYNRPTTSYYYNVLPPPAHITLTPNPTEVNKDITLRVTEIIDVTLHSTYNENTEDALVKEVLSKYAETNDISLGRHKVGDTISLNFKDFAGNDIPIFDFSNIKPPDKDLQSKIGINKLLMVCIGSGIDPWIFNESLPVLITDAPGTGIKLVYGYFYMNLVLNLNITDKTGRIIEYDEISYRIAGSKVFETLFPNIDTSTVVKTQDKQVTIPLPLIADSSGKLQSLPQYGVEVIVSAKGYQQFKQTFAVKDLLIYDDLNILSVRILTASSIPIEIQMEPESYAISIVQGTGGTISASTATATMDTIVTLTATPATGYEFVSWSVTGPSGAIAVSNNTFTMPAGAVTVSATFRLISYSITINQAVGGTISASAAAATMGTQITLTAAADNYYEFTSWSVTTAAGAAVTVTGNKFTMPASNVTVTAAYRRLARIVGFTLDRNLMKTDSAGCLTYVEEAAGYTPMSNAAHGNADEGSWANAWPFNTIKPVVLNTNGTVYKYLNKANMSQYEDGSSATSQLSSASYDTFVEFSKLYYKVVINGTKSTLYFSDVPGDGFKIHPAFLIDGKEKDKIYIARYKGYVSSSKLYSRSGVSPTVNTTRSTFRSYAQGRGSGFNQISYWDWDLVASLYALAFKNLNSQVALGYGYVNGSSRQSTGGTNSQSWIYGNNSQTGRISFLGLEDWWGNIWNFIDNFINVSGTLKAGTSSQPDDSGTGYEIIGSVSTQIDTSILTCKGEEKSFWIADQEGGSNTTGLCDYQWIYNSGTYLGCAGGNWGDGLNAGAFYLAASDSLSSSGYFDGSRLAYKP